MKSISMLIVAACVVCVASCTDSTLYVDKGPLTVTVTNSKSFDPSISTGSINMYQVTVVGDDFDAITQEFGGESASAIVDGIPSGVDRIVTVKAVNVNGACIKEGTTPNIEIRGGRNNSVDVRLEDVPVFVNITDGSVIAASRLKLKVFHVPGADVTVDDEYNGVMAPLFDMSTGSAILSITGSDGVATMTPPLLPAGEHVFSAKSTTSGRSSSVRVVIVDGEALHGASFPAAASKNSRAGDVLMNGRRE